MTGCKKNVNSVLKIARHLMMMAEECIADCEHDECLLLHGVLLDAGHKIFSTAEECRQKLEETAPPHRSCVAQSDKDKACAIGWQA